MYVDFRVCAFEFSILKRSQLAAPSFVLDFEL